MVIDRNGISLYEGDTVRLTEGMSVKGFRMGVVRNIDGEYIDIFVSGVNAVVERYGSELEKVL